MKALEIPNLPDEVYSQIEEGAKVRGKSVADMAADYLIKALADEDAEARLMGEVRAEREQLAREGVWITDEDIKEGREWGRK